ncbi:hypothetical protein Pflav_010090 [Phytohabitans flavus]|uniref:GGDEF domain-containing protein n=1 Tax=Phytohabitans flavus TaxID=1076124 RepID=A0A6F8XLD4_9ACTN|nr:hypothetical protein Pflav_010090 [Phytohabitans flavus]
MSECPATKVESQPAHSASRAAPSIARSAAMTDPAAGRVSTSELLHRADEAMYAAKRERNTGQSAAETVSNGAHISSAVPSPQTT